MGKRVRLAEGYSQSLAQWLLPPPVIIRRGKTTIRRYSGRSVHHMEEVKGKIVECVEFYTSSESHSIDVCFQDKTTLHFSIDPGFLLETEYANWKTGNWQRIKRWPTLRSAPSPPAPPRLELIC